jgi:murein DD-endopeptidase MepM/ murein hydrolase activator NlpD
VYWEWSQGNTLTGFANYFGAEPDDILNAPMNNLDPATTDPANPNIPDGTWLFVPNGRREFISWSAPLGVTRENPASARVLGPGACDPVSGGAVGFGAFVWPAAKHYLSGFDYAPNANHWGLDLAGNEGEGVFSTDAGVVVYAGWNNYGYGNMIMVDHGNNFQSLYAHLSGISVGCGQSVGQGDLIGTIGNTGRSSGSHLHFEIRAISSWVNPWDVLPPP